MKTLIFTALLASSTTLAFANNDKLKRSCLKKYPVMLGIYDTELIGIFSRICDKKNMDVQNASLIQATQRFQYLGFNFQALQLLGSLEAQGVNHEGLNKVKFLIGAQLTDDALRVMQANQSKNLSEPQTIQAATILNTQLQKVFSTAISPNQVDRVLQEKSQQVIKKRRRVKIQTKQPTIFTKPVKQTQNKQITPFTNL